MQKTSLTVVATAAALSLGMPIDRASAMFYAHPMGVRAVANDVSMAERVHCVSGNPHHRIGQRHWSDGCSGLAFDSVNVPMNLFFGWHRSGMRGGNLNRGTNQGYGLNQNRGINQTSGPTQSIGANPNRGAPNNLD